MPLLPRRATFSLCVCFGSCALAVVFVTRHVRAQSEKEEAPVGQSLKAFADVYNLVEQNYAEPVDANKAIYHGAIPGMLRVLDPHSSFLDPEEYARRREEQHGEYFGVGMLIGEEDHKITVRVAFEGSPSFRAGVRPGDVIVAINGKSTVGISVEDTSNMLKGPRGTHVQITFSREGVEQPIPIDLVRAEIEQPSVDLKKEIRPGIGYIHLTQFQETTAREMAYALAGFGPNLKGLILDLRDNPGGIVVQAVATCDNFLEKGQVVVSQRGRSFPEEVLRATHGNGGKTYPIVVLINRNTASAAEIVSGALQDHDRALIVGETSFGKGLVQRMYPLSNDTALLLTTYHYYTPSGRLIQRNYDGLSLLDYYYGRDGLKSTKDREIKLTDAGRTVYGGGGIAPDVAVAPQKLGHFQEALIAHDTFFHFASRYLATRSVTKDFQADGLVLDHFRSYLSVHSIPFTEQQMTDNADWIKSNIKASIFAAQFGQTKGAEVRLEADTLVTQAIGYLPQAATLEQQAVKLVAQKLSVGGLNRVP